MAKKAKVNKSAAIREAIASGLSKPAEITVALAKKKIKVSPQMVSQVKAKTGGGKKAKKRGRKKMATATNGHLDLRALLSAKKLVEDVGSIQAAKEALGALEKITA